jgi:histidyl-tRNA synthetase
MQKAEKKIIKKSVAKKMARPKKKKDLILQPPKGMHDILPADQPLWDRVRKVTKDVSRFYRFSRIDTPIVERAEIFEVSVGASTDLIEKQMYTFGPSNNRLALRPENTASIARAYVQHGLDRQMGRPVKLYYQGPFFRHERPQSGRYRQFHQVGFEIISRENDPVYDTQVITASFRIIEGLKIKDCVVRINSIGCGQCRPNFIKKLRSYYKGKNRKICVDCRKRIKSNPLRVFDCKEEKCKEFAKSGPNVLDSLCGSCKKHFQGVLELLEDVSVPYALTPHLVRGLDYYTNTVFEIFTEGFDSALAAGGRYNGLITLMGGKEDTPAVGAALGVERLIEVVKAREIKITKRSKPRVFLIHIGATAKHKSMTLIEDFRKANIDVVESLGKESLNAQLKAADKEKSPIALILGQKEAYEESIIIRDMKTGAQETIPLEKAVDIIKKRI